MIAKSHLQDFLHVPSGRGHRGPAMRVGIGIALPLLAVVLLGRLDLCVYVIFGSLTGVFGRADAPRLRFQHLVIAGALMSGSVIAGAAAAIAGFDPWASTAAAVVVASVLSVVSDRLQLRPAGPFFFLYAFTTIAGVPGQSQLGDAALAALASAALVVVLGFLLASPPRGAPEAGTIPPPEPVAWPDAVARACRYAVAVGAAGSVAIASGLGHHHWAILAATAPIAAADLAGAANRVVHSIIGTFAGVALTGALLLVEWSPLGLALLLAALQFANELYAVRHSSLALVFLTPVALLMTSFVVTTPARELIGDRVVETGIGAALALLLVSATSGMRSLSGRAGGQWPRLRAGSRR
ncbi:FUSC family protein [Kocuria sp. p3-SID1433]|uniref:FUSC family protein n=1 Tax=unclassified Kocuria TaxID=2649579 RepID=UPI0021A70967|nr:MULTISPECIES: FUSC family protein [unclassified Kocuria]MCT1602824.1 FUSC family protein [Kocuria sp. p3-SID1428]MCT2181301.1 FUSC family protein [Kocuria sp. p3-SID1433]